MSRFQMEFEFPSPANSLKKTRQETRSSKNCMLLHCLTAFCAFCYISIILVGIETLSNHQDARFSLFPMPLKSISPLCIYYINLDQSTKRRENFERHITSLPTHLFQRIHLRRVPAITSDEVKTMIANRSFVLNGIKKLVSLNVALDWWERQYTFREAACTLSHLKAIYQAYCDGHQATLIVEDDANLTVEFLGSWKRFVDLAPVDWNVLQWRTNNGIIIKKEVFRSNDFWLSWSGYHWSTIAYTINRDGMERVLKRTSVGNITKCGISRQWRFDEPDMMAADELIYFAAGNTYTSSFCWIKQFDFKSTISYKHTSSFFFGNSKQLLTDDSCIKRSESIAVIEHIRMGDAYEVRDGIRSLNADFCSLTKYHPNSQWFVQVVLTSSDLLPFFKKEAAMIPAKYVQFQVNVSPRRFNKFVFVKEKLKTISTFDLLLLKDDDIRISGFEWNTFLDSGEKSIIRGPFRNPIERTLHHFKKTIHEYQKDPSVYVNLQDASLFNTYQDTGYQNVDSISVMTLEEFMVVMRSDFAVWFFGQILTSLFLSQDIDWGPDLMWCGAAHMFRDISRSVDGTTLVPCSLISVNAADIDNKEIAKAKERESHRSYVNRGNQVIETFKKNSSLKSWIDASNRPILNYRSLRGWCSHNSKNQRICDCLKDYHRKRVVSFSVNASFS